MNAHIRAACSVAVLVMHAGCATPYKDNGLYGGSEVSMITPTRAIVSFQGNGFTNSDKVQQYVMLRAAELTYESGFSHFRVLGTEDAGQTSTVVAYGQYFATAAPIESPKTRLVIEMQDGNPTNDPSVFSAATVINTIRPTL